MDSFFCPGTEILGSEKKGSKKGSIFGTWVLGRVWVFGTFFEVSEDCKFLELSNLGGQKICLVWSLCELLSLDSRTLSSEDFGVWEKEGSKRVSFWDLVLGRVWVFGTFFEVSEDCKFLRLSNLGVQKFVWSGLCELMRFGLVFLSWD